MSTRRTPRTTKVRAAHKPIRRKPRALTGYGAYKALENDTASEAYARGKAAGLRSKKRNATGINDQTIGQKIGSGIGSALGLGAEHFVKWLTGMGDYDVKENILLSQDPPPMINDSAKGGTMIRKREFLKDIYTSPTPGAFSLENFFINPANEKTFPFLHQVAMNYEQYALEGMIFEFRSMSADALNSTNTALGSVCMATNYDAVDVNFKQKSEMENYEFGNSCKPSVNMMHPIECAKTQTVLQELYTLNGPVPTGADPRLYYWGNFQIATVGFQGASVNIGELWVSYQVRLIKPKLYVALGNEIGTYVSLNSSYTNALPLGNGTLDTLYNTIGIIWDPPNRNIGFPILGVRKHYEVIIRWTGNLTAITYPTLLFSNCTSTSLINANGPAGGETATSAVSVFSVMVDANTFGVVQLGTAGVLPSAGNQVRVLITEINPFDK